MPQLTPSAQPIMEALQTASNRGWLPTDMGSADIVKLGNGLYRQAFFAARMGSAEAAAEFKKFVDRLVKGGYNNDLAKVRMEAKQLLNRLGYTPQIGFPERAGNVPEAEPGSLQDLSSDRRLNLIFETQQRLARGLTQQAQGAARASAYPAWELARIYQRRVPRGSVSSGSPGWESRWVQCGGPPLIHDRMIALKNDPIWAALGDRDNFPDALGVDHPPFAFNSGYGWKRELSKAECVQLGVTLSRVPTSVFRDAASGTRNTENEPTLPKKLDDATRLALLKKIREMAGGQKLSEGAFLDAIRQALPQVSASNEAGEGEKGKVKSEKSEGFEALMLLALFINTFNRSKRS